MPDLDLDQHVAHVRLPSPGSPRQLLDLAGAQAGESFDPARPLWHITLVDGLDGNRSALVVKVHHAVTDGVGGVALLPIFTDPEPNPAVERDLASAPPTPGRPSQPGLWQSAVSALEKATLDPSAALTVGPRFARVDGQAAGSRPPTPSAR